MPANSLTKKKAHIAPMQRLMASGKFAITEEGLKMMSRKEDVLEKSRTSKRMSQDEIVKCEVSADSCSLDYLAALDCIRSRASPVPTPQTHLCMKTPVPSRN